MALPEELKGLVSIVICTCGEKLPLEVLRSNAGHYVGRFCPNCGPYSRESHYFTNRADAVVEALLLNSGFGEHSENLREV